LRVSTSHLRSLSFLLRMEMSYVQAILGSMTCCRLICARRVVLEVSPYNQELQVLIDKNGKFNEKWNTANFKHSATIQPDRPGWDAVMEVPLKDLAWNGEPATLAGNAFAILGAKGARRFYSAYLPPQQRPNFHEPGFFKPFPLDDT
jgi:hypothetical protein